MKAKDLAALLMKRPDCEVVYDTGSEYFYTVDAPSVRVLVNTNKDNVKEEVLALSMAVPSHEFTI